MLADGGDGHGDLEHALDSCIVSCIGPDGGQGIGKGHIRLVNLCWDENELGKGIIVQHSTSVRGCEYCVSRIDAYVSKSADVECPNTEYFEILLDSNRL